MDDVRALLAVLPEAPLPSEAEVEHADGLIIVFPQDESEYAAAAERVSSAIELGPPIYVVIPPLDSGLARKYLQSTLQPGVYGVAVQTAASVDQLRYLEGLLEELEIRADIRPGLTAMAVGFHDPRAINIMSDCLSAMRDSADRMTWIAFDHVRVRRIAGGRAGQRHGDLGQLAGRGDRRRLPAAGGLRLTARRGLRGRPRVPRLRDRGSG